MIIDLKRVFDLMRNNTTLNMLTLIDTPHNVLESLIEEPHIPRDYPLIMDYLVPLIEDSGCIIESLGDDYYTDLEVELEKLQIFIDAYLANFIQPNLRDTTIEYEVIKWLGGTTVFLLANPQGAMRYER